MKTTVKTPKSERLKFLTTKAIPETFAELQRLSNIRYTKLLQMVLYSKNTRVRLKLDQLAKHIRSSFGELLYRTDKYKALIFILCKQSTQTQDFQFILNPYLEDILSFIAQTISNSRTRRTILLRMLLSINYELNTNSLSVVFHYKNLVQQNVYAALHAHRFTCYRLGRHEARTHRFILQNISHIKK